ncbi:undecaprenyl-phosphate glucose phosphotransferase [Chelatococcus asaccharovorans]|uniref:undecaprenyl-phosphate glucose phosphotransferase n=1 Tax=Chelatococcus asaccharovorans TaxID=28210 RepID=UPI00224C63AB|nr:undecaprenyl-phosphate glucose phosphotransferase [Chelatococcus asaccharovorans]CAH1662216.1 Undecaprenyl-phosphate glucose phosphotransferase [Chelatococcus asaccharovorans]CAH1683237.1 Undecaprenyl-phosphate glucose phosphotransferase [Chelatococcus asaccharovorans]
MAETDTIPTHADFSAEGTTLSRSVFSAAALVGDVAVIVGASWLTGIAYHWLAYGDAGPLALFLNAGLATAVLFVAFGVLSGAYHHTRYLSFRSHATSVVRLWTLAFLSVVLLLFVLKTSEDYSRGAFLLLYAVCPIALLVGRYAMVALVSAANDRGLIASQRLYVVGGKSDIAAFLKRYRPGKFGVKVVGTAIIEPRQAGEDAAGLRHAVESARRLNSDSVFIALPWSDLATIDQTVKAFSKIPAEIHLSPERILERFEDVSLVQRGPLSSLQLARPPLAPYEVIFKRSFDIVVASLALIMLSPLMLIVAALVRLDSKGPALFVQRRFGFNQKEFRIYKFRTMMTQDDGDVIRQATRNDPRVTRIGRRLRRWNLDELPQLINVLQGHMSIVGPRPHALAHDREYEAKIGSYARRHNMKPGITGWAQVNGYRGQTDTDSKMEKRVEFDLYYIDNWSLFLDIKIMAMTVFHPHSYRNAL